MLREGGYSSGFLQGWWSGLEMAEEHRSGFVEALGGSNYDCYKGCSEQSWMEEEQKGGSVALKALEVPDDSYSCNYGRADSRVAEDYGSLARECLGRDSC